MVKINKIKTKIYADGASLKDFKKFRSNNLISGFTTNPSLMRKAGVKDYEDFAKKVCKIILKKPISFEIFADNKKEIDLQARTIAKWGKNVFVKIPIINTRNISNQTIGDLNKEGIKINVTAVFTIEQSKLLLKEIGKKTELILSVFAGRIADTGVDPVHEIKKHIKLFKNYKNVKILWASVRENYNIIESSKSKCHIITVPSNILSKLNQFNKNLIISIETVKGFYNDKTKFKIKTN